MPWSLDPSEPLLDDCFPLPTGSPFTKQQAEHAHLTRHNLARLVQLHLLRRVLPGVYVAAQVPDDLHLRVQALSLVAPADAVAVDETALWLHTGVLPPNGHLQTPLASFFRHPGSTRIRQRICSGGERSLLPEDVMTVGTLTVTTPLRTALDLGRLAPRDWAMAGLDALLRTGAFEKQELLWNVERFRRQRGVVQLRDLAPRTDPRAESPGESVLRLRWTDMPSLPTPEPQVPVVSATGGAIYYIDLGVPELLFGAEYDGEEHHTDEEDREHDRRRRTHLQERFSWIIKPVTRHNVFGVRRDVERVLVEGIADARARLYGLRRPASVTGRPRTTRHP